MKKIFYSLIVFLLFCLQNFSLANDFEQLIDQEKNFIPINFKDVSYHGVPFVAVTSKEVRDGYGSEKSIQRAITVCKNLGYHGPVYAKLNWINFNSSSPPVPYFSHALYFDENGNLLESTFTYSEYDDYLGRRQYYDWATFKELNCSKRK